VKSAQDFFDLLAGLRGFSSQPETIAETPHFLVEIRAMPLKSLDRTVRQYQEIAFTIPWHPSVTRSDIPPWHALQLSDLNAPSKSSIIIN